jgi:putative protease
MTETLEPRVGTVTHFFSRLKVATVKLEGPVRLGDRLHVKGKHDDFVVRVRSMQIDHAPIERAEAGQVVGIRLGRKAHDGDAVLRTEPSRRWWMRLFGP